MKTVLVGTFFVLGLSSISVWACEGMMAKGTTADHAEHKAHSSRGHQHSGKKHLHTQGDASEKAVEATSKAVQ